MICITYICLKMKHMTDGKATDLKDFICFLHFIKYKANPHTDTYCVIETVVIHNATTCPVILTLRNQYIRSCCCD